MNTHPSGFVTTVYLEMRSAPPSLQAEPPLEDISIERIVDPPVPFYREMYSAIGDMWNWSERKKLPDDQVRKIIQNEDVFIFTIRVKGTIVGFAELDFRSKPHLELKYFGLVPDWIGKGIGSYFLQWTIGKAWELEPERYWLHTCTNDHPRALETYTRAGFVQYKLETKAS